MTGIDGLEGAQDVVGESIPRKYQVFVSSTFKDLKEHRSTAMLAIVSAGHMATCLENWGIQNQPPLDVIKRAVEDCQFYVIILGHSYGSIPEGMESSFTELELDFAEKYFGSEHAKRILSFVLEDGLVSEQRSRLDRSVIDESRELKNTVRYEAFRSRLTASGRWYRPFRDARDIDRDLYAFFREPHPDVPGYVRESEETELIVRISTSNKIVKEVVQRAGRFTVVEKRMSQSAGKKQALAKAFCELHGKHVRSGLIDKLFVESGSTLSFLAAELAPFLPRVGQGQAGSETHEKAARPKPVVSTNNALAYLDMWLCHGVVCRPEPDSPPTEDEKYGAMYGPLAGANREPDYSLPVLREDDPDSWSLVESVRDVFLTDVPDPTRSMVLAAASGLQLGPDITAIEPLDPANPMAQKIPYTYEPVLKLVRKCRGFHVGSYENKLLKRSLYLSGIPTIVFIHDSKIDCRIEVGKCHFLFDKAAPWEEFVAEYPLSIWVGCDRDSCERVVEKMSKHLPESWRFRPLGNGKFPVVVAHNASFRKACLTAGIAVYQ